MNTKVKMNFKDEKKWQDFLANYKVKCICGHTITMFPKGNDFRVCTWCGEKVYKNKQRQLENIEEIKRRKENIKKDRFKSKLVDLLNEQHEDKPKKKK